MNGGEECQSGKEERVQRALLAGQDEDARRNLLEQHAQLPEMDAARRAQLDLPKFWETFYRHKKATFFKDRHNLRAEFPEMMPDSVRDDPVKWCAPLARKYPTLSEYAFDTQQPPPEEILRGKEIFLELGCGVGNAVFPLLRANPSLFGFACDFSSTSIKVFRESPEYDPERVFAFVADVTHHEQLHSILSGVSGCVKYITAVWVLSALEPASVQELAPVLFSLLAPGGLLLIRDYAFGDLSQLRMRSESKIASNFYVCGDNTRRHFFTEEWLQHCFEQAGFVATEMNTIARNITNHKEGVEKNRRWIQAKFARPK
ncbi:Methyltransferase-like protein 2B [Porphyridium purpureum]|uniref:tRNA N(3)-methylcytidine methyltransferase n=1 Tax=Porphyridium purpureum TaxID=35688 RepID=A0A5J4YV60_PORPP|nr:Methyltransferase-like protein 2B [Porphyridium purpureum]|eukprot:POR9603..scf227_4